MADNWETQMKRERARQYDLNEVNKSIKWDNWKGPWQNDQVWKDFEKKIFARDKYVCQFCLDEKATEIIPESLDYGAMPPATKMFSVCNSCAQRWKYGWKETDPGHWYRNFM